MMIHPLAIPRFQLIDDDIRFLQYRIECLKSDPDTQEMRDVMTLKIEELKADRFKLSSFYKV